MQKANKIRFFIYEIHFNMFIKVLSNFNKRLNHFIMKKIAFY